MTLKRTRKIDMDIILLGHEQNVTLTVDYIDIPGNPERADEPARQPSVEILCCRVPVADASIDISWMFDEATTQAITEEFL